MPTPQNGQKYSKHSSTVAVEFLEWVRPFVRLALKWLKYWQDRDSEKKVIDNDCTKNEVFH